MDAIEEEESKHGDGEESRRSQQQNNGSSKLPELKSNIGKSFAVNQSQ
jgi:hypothetical protein